MSMDEKHRAIHPSFMPINDSLLSRESWKIFQIMAEFVEGFERLAQIKPSVSIFGSARTPQDHPYYKLTEDIARALSDAGFSVVSGGGPGLMEAANKGCYAGKSPSIGVNIVLPQEPTANEKLPGGCGTLDELAEILTLVQTGKTRRIPIILVHRPFWEGLINWFKSTLVREGTIDESDLELFQILDEPQEVVDAIFNHYESRGFEPSVEEQEILLDL